MKKVFSKFIILLIIFAGVVAGILYLTRDKSEKAKIVMSEPTLPTVTLLTTGTAGANSDAADIEVNRLFGYTAQMETRYMRDSITPLPDDRKLKIRINNLSNVIMGASFEVRSLDCERLIENTEIKKEAIVDDADNTEITIELQNMLDKDTEYNLVFCLNTDRHENIYYYTRVKMLTENYCKQEIEFVQKFSSNTLDNTKSNDIISYIEPDASQDNSNFGYVNIHSSFSQITWGELTPEKVNEPVVTIKEILGDVGCYELKYKIKAKNDYDTYQYYNVVEFYRIKWTSTEMYLLDYTRKTDQVFDETNQNISVSRINMGIYSNPDKCIFKSSDNTKFIAFSKKNGLWLMDISENKVTSLFSFEDSEDDDIRDSNDNNDIQIVSVSDNGDMSFLVYGYINRGVHEGMVGVSLYEYSNNDNIVEEKIFIPFTKPYQILKETVGKLAYVNADNTMYLLLDDCIYSVELGGNEYVQLVSGLRDGSYSVNKMGSIMAWQIDNSPAGSEAIKVLDFETGVETVINAEAETKIKVLGFVDNDLAYGVSNNSGKTYVANGTSIVPMHEIRISDIEKNVVLKTYSKAGYYFTEAKISGNMINIKRVSLNADGTAYNTAPDYQIFGNEETETNVVEASTITTEQKKTEVVISFVTKVTSSNKLKTDIPNEIIVNDANAMSIKELAAKDSKFYAYGHGVVLGIYNSIADAIVTADESNGVVIDESGDYAWARESKPTNYQLNNVTIGALAAAGDVAAQQTICINSVLAANGVQNDVAGEVAAGKTIQNILEEQLKDYNCYDLTGCTLGQVLYYVYKGEPVIAALDGSNYVIVVGYDFYNAVLLSPVSGQVYKQGLEETTSLFTQNGNKFISLSK